MVSTRNHPKQFPEPTLSPSKQPRAKSTGAGEDEESTVVTRRTRSRSVPALSHTSSSLAIGWLFISITLVIWDTGYVLGRPFTMTGAKWHTPVYSPYALYATVDYLYGLPAWERNDGFVGAQAMMNIVETVLYIIYLYLVFTKGTADKSSKLGLLKKRQLIGWDAGLAFLIAFVAFTTTLSKTILYVLVLGNAGWADVSHNSATRFFILWLIPNGAWILFPAVLLYDFCSQTLEQFAGIPQKKIE